MTIYIFPMFSNIMRNSLWIWVAIFSLLVFAIAIASIGFVFGQTIPTTNSTPIFVVQPQATEQIQQVAQQTDNNTIIGLVSGIATLVVFPFVTKLLSDKNKKV